jgi:magnesium transporter
MIYLSTLLRRAVYDIHDRRVGTLRDIVVSLEDIFPAVKAIVIRPTPFTAAGTSHNGRNQDLFVPWEQVADLEEAPIYLKVSSDQIARYALAASDVLLARDILDKQIVDTQGVRVVKVNDLKLAQIKGTARLVGVDISFRGLLRRLGAETPANAIARLLPFKLPERTITWNYVEPLEATPAPALVPAATSIAGVRLNVSHAKLADLHPADIADIIEQLDITDAREILQQLDAETAADTLNAVEPARQAELVGKLDPERASDLLEIMPPDGAADILADLPPEAAQQLLNLMPQEEAQPIRELLRYGESTAGGIMTTEVLALTHDMTVQEALAYLRSQGRHLEMVYYLYVVDAERHLVGVVSLRRLVTSEPQAKLGDIMDTDVIRVSSNTDQEEVARLIAKYDLLALPVVDGEDRLVGLVTVEDVIDVIQEENTEDFSELSGASPENLEELHFSWSAARSRLGWLSISLIAGVLAAMTLHSLLAFFPLDKTGALPVASALIVFAPLLLFTSGSMSSQAASMAGWYLRERRIALFVAAASGLLLPLALQRFNVHGGWASSPFLEPAIALFCLELFIGIGFALSFHL